MTPSQIVETIQKDKRMGKYLLNNAKVVTGEYAKKGAVAITDGRIEKIFVENDEGVLDDMAIFQASKGREIIDLEGKVLMAGGIDAHVHFREPGSTQKADMFSESRAALLGGITSVIDMPNNNPPATTKETIQAKHDLAKGRMWTNYSFHIGVTNTNAEEIENLIETDPNLFAGVKVFMGSSTGGMLVNDDSTLSRVFDIKKKPVLVHSEDEGVIKANLEKAKEQYGDDIPISEHPNIRSRIACIKTSIKALEMAIAKGTRLHLCHLTTKEEIHMVRAAKIQKSKVTAESSSNYMWFCDQDYPTYGAKIKCNPSIKTEEDKQLIRDAFHDGIIDTIGSDHAPHLLSEKDAPYTKCPSGMPSIQQSFAGVVTVALAEETPLERVASAMSEKSAEIFQIKDRGYIKEGYIADLVVIDPDTEFTVGDKNAITSSAHIDYKCGWSPYDGMTLKGGVKMVFLSGEKVVENGKLLIDTPNGEALSFE